MKIFLDDIPEADGLDVDVTEGEDVLNRSFCDGLESLLRFVSPVTGVFHVTRRKRTLILDLAVKGTLAANCSRCLGEFDYLLDDVSRLTLFAREEGGEEESDEISERDYYDGESVDLGALLKEEIALKLPDKPLCSEGCKGLCPNCGKNLNEGSCACVGEDDGGRFGVLKKLKFD